MGCLDVAVIAFAIVGAIVFFTSGTILSWLALAIIGLYVLMMICNGFVARPSNEAVSAIATVIVYISRIALIVVAIVLAYNLYIWFERHGFSFLKM